MYRELEKELCLQRFKEYDDDGSGTIDPGELLPLLESFGVRPTDETLHDAITECDIVCDFEFEKFLELMTWLRRREIANFKIKQGFTDVEMEHLEYTFKKVDRDGGGDLDVPEILLAMGQWANSPDIPDGRRQMFSTLSQPKTREEQQRFREFMLLASEEGPPLDFQAFVKLMRVIYNEVEREEHIQEEIAAEECGFSRQAYILFFTD